MKYFLAILLICTGIGTHHGQTVGEEIEGYLLVEAENFVVQAKDSVRKWQIIDSTSTLSEKQKKFQAHLTAGQKKYLQVLPDTRKTHDDSLIHGENFSNEPGRLAVISYPVKINTPGKYYVWVRAFSTGTEDNGIHVGLDGEWPESGQRMQWCEGKNQWTWASKQRTQEVHCGEDQLIYLEIEEAGIHTISFSMREDGFAFDQWALSQIFRIPGD